MAREARCGGRCEPLGQPWSSMRENTNWAPTALGAGVPPSGLERARVPRSAIACRHGAHRRRLGREDRAGPPRPLLGPDDARPLREGDGRGRPQRCRAGRKVPASVARRSARDRVHCRKSPHRAPTMCRKKIVGLAGIEPATSALSEPPKGVRRSGRFSIPAAEGPDRLTARARSRPFSTVRSRRGSRVEHGGEAVKVRLIRSTRGPAPTRHSSARFR